MADSQDEEVALRTEYALKIQNDIQRQVKDFRLSNVHLAMFAIAPLSIFQPGGTLGDANPTRVVHQYLETFPPLVKHFLARWSDKAYNKHLTSHPNTPAVPSTTLKSDPRERQGEQC
ncbi:HNHc domain-containing protein [Fusarium sp. LHS14.1]|nr:HNHc domain-containing protein [Fusarium sp. LHS14.1]